MFLLFPHHRQVARRIWPADLARMQILKTDEKKAKFYQAFMKQKKYKEEEEKQEEEEAEAALAAKAEEDEKSRRERLSCTCMSVCVCIDDEPWISEEDEEDYEEMEEIGSDYSYFHVSCTCMSVCVCNDDDDAEPVDEAEDMDEILAEPVDMEPVDNEAEVPTVRTWNSLRQQFELAAWIDI